ncbi:hypothetical protein JHK82_049951 [Glycine max]|nr:hypothetical protein JHK82_049951 [Glycine max]
MAGPSTWTATRQLTDESTRCRHVSNSPTPLASPLQKETPGRKRMTSIVCEMGGSCSRAWPARSYLSTYTQPQNGFSISSLVVMMRYLVPAD